VVVKPAALYVRVGMVYYDWRRHQGLLEGGGRQIASLASFRFAVSTIAFLGYLVSRRTARNEGLVFSFLKCRNAFWTIEDA
jgi:hypothetical protein